jgi:hypothetical protein
LITTNYTLISFTPESIRVIAYSLARLSAQLLRALMADTDAWEKVSFENDEDAPIPFMRSAESRANE